MTDRRCRILLDHPFLAEQIGMLQNTIKPGRRKSRTNNVIAGSAPIVSSTPASGRKVSDQGYRVRANPQVDDSGRLELVRFTADYGAKVHLEWTVSAAQLAGALATIDSPAMRHLALEQLRFGMRTELPGTYTAAQLLAIGLRKLQ